MKTAILLSGQMRTFATCAYTQRWHVYRHFPDADFYVSTVEDKDAASVDVLRKLYPHAKIKTEVVGSQPNLPEPTENVRFEPYPRSVPMQAVLRQLWQLEKAWRLVKEPEEYDCFLRVRPDSFFHSFVNPVGTMFRQWAFTPWWGRFGGVNDRFAVLGRDAAKAYFTTYGQIPQLIEAGCPIHPESLVAGSLSLAGCVVNDTLRAEFSTLKHEGARPPEIIGMDIAHMRAG